MVAADREIGLLGVTREKTMPNRNVIWSTCGLRLISGESRGFLLLKAVLDHLRDSGVHTVWLYILNGNYGAMHLYQSFGFQSTN